MSKGQITAGDFILSISIFTLILVIIIPLFSQMSYDRESSIFQDEIKTKLAFLSDSLTKTQGFPTNWTNETAISIGLASSNEKINKTKIKRFLSTDKWKAKDSMALQGLEFNASFYVGGYYLMTGEAYSPSAYYFISEEKIYSMLNNSGLVWDIYSGGTPENTEGSREIYTGDPVQMFSSMIDNSSMYRTIIIEDAYDPGMDIDGLKSFVQKGGILILEGDARLISSGFSMSSGTHAGGDGVVQNEEFMGFNYDTNVTFPAANWYFESQAGDASLGIYAADKSDTSRAYIGGWQHGIGKVFYITDIEGSVDGTGIMERINLVGEKAEFSTSWMQDRQAITRPVIFDTDINSVGIFTLVIGK